MHVVIDERIGIAFSICSCSWRSAIYRHCKEADSIQCAGFALVELAEHVLTDCTWRAHV